MSVKYKTDDDLISAVRTWLHEQHKEQYWQGIHALVSRWHKAAEVEGDSVEKLGLETNLLTWIFVISWFLNKYLLQKKKQGIIFLATLTAKALELKSRLFVS
jgi:hypothetical protein